MLVLLPTVILDYEYKWTIGLTDKIIMGLQHKKGPNSRKTQENLDKHEIFMSFIWKFFF